MNASSRFKKSFIAELKAKFNPQAQEQKMTFREFLEILDDFTAQADIEFISDMAGNEDQILILEHSNFIVDRAIELYRAYYQYNGYEDVRP
jgi:hypothetical protein